MQVKALDTLVSDYPLISEERVEKYLLPLLSSTEQGFSQDLRTPLFLKSNKEAPAREEILDDWAEILDVQSLDPELAKVELEQRSKVGPYSIRLPFTDEGGLKENLLPYFDVPSAEGEETILNKAAQSVKDLIDPDHLRPISLEEAVRKAPKSTNWGLPYMLKGTVGVQRYADISRQILRGNRDLFWPSLLGWRGQARGLKEAPKQRVVWMFPHSTTLIEGMYLYPVLNRLRAVGSIFAGWRTSDIVDNTVNDMFKRNRPILSFDASSFDSSIPANLIQIAFDCLRLWFQPSSLQILNTLETEFYSSGIVTPEGIWIDRNGAVPSGSGLTNLIDSLVNVLLYYYVGYALNLRPTVDGVTVLGDDALWQFDSDEIPLDQVRSVLSELNITINPEKQYLSNNVAHYLQNVHVSDSALMGSSGVRPSYRVLGNMLSYERFKNGWNSEFDSMRWIMQLENAKNHPKFRELVMFAKRGDKKYELGLKAPGGIAGLFRRNGRVIESFLGIESFKYNRPDIDGWRNFATIRVLEGK